MGFKILANFLISSGKLLISLYFFFLFALGIYIFWNYFKFYYYKCLFALIPDSVLFIPFIFIPSYYLNTLEFTLLLINIWMLQLTTFTLKFTVILLEGITSLVEKRPIRYMVYTYTHAHPYVINTGDINHERTLCCLA